MIVRTHKPNGSRDRRVEAWHFSIQCLAEQLVALQWRESVGIAIPGEHLLHNHSVGEGCNPRCTLARVDPENPTPYMQEVAEGSVLPAAMPSWQDV